MKQMKLLCVFLIMISLVPFSTNTVGKEMDRIWLTSACYRLRLSVWDKMSLGKYLAKYTVTSTDGRVFVAERNATEDSNTAEVFFPDDFHDEKTNLKAWIDCRYGENYTWSIYANGVLIDSGTIAFSRKNK